MDYNCTYRGARQWEETQLQEQVAALSLKGVKSPRTPEDSIQRGEVSV